MRPQHITAENERSEENLGVSEPASMRPQHITAENAILRADGRPARTLQ